MKVLIINGSPHKEGNTATALQEMKKVFEQEGVEADVDIERSGAAEQHGGVHVRIGVNNPEQITAEIRHHIGKLALARADIRHHLRHFHRIRGGCRSRIQQYVSLHRYPHFSCPDFSSRLPIIYLAPIFPLSPQL